MRFPVSIFALANAGISLPLHAEVPAVPAARVEGSSIIHPRESITVRLPSAAVYLGSERFELYGVADAEVHIFAEPGADIRMRRLWWVQFESYLPGNDHRYNYADGNRKIDLGGTATWMIAGPRSTTGHMRPGLDREHVFGILKRAGIAIPAEVMNVRLVQLLDDPQGTGKGARRELMVIYSEDLSLTGKTLAGLTSDGQPNPAWAAIEPGLIQRARESVSIERK